MVVVPPPVIAFDWLLPGVAWRGVGWRGLVVPHYRLLPSASLAIFHGGVAGYGSYSFLPPFRSEHSLGSSRKFTSDANGV